MSYPLSSLRHPFVKIPYSQYSNDNIHLINQEERVNSFYLAKMASLILVYHIFCSAMALE